MKQGQAITKINRGMLVCDEKDKGVKLWVHV